MRFHIFVAWVAFLVIPGCAIIPLWVADNQPLPAEQRTRARLGLEDSDLSHGVFVGVAMSGGGMRAANFSAAILLELEGLGLLRHVSAVSSVSGSSLTAAYFGLFGPVNGRSDAAVANRWTVDAVKERFVADVQTHWLIAWFNPWNAVRYWFTGFDRSDIMKDVFDGYLLGSPGRRHPTFADMPGGRPKILINATSLPDVGRFVFTDETFEALGSRLDRYRLSHAVMASGAFPGAFHNVTLRNHLDPGKYQHLFDGGPADNLGVDTLVEMLDNPGPKPTACFLFVVDAHPYERNQGRSEFDTRSVLDFFVDHNISDSASVFLTLARRRALHRIGLPLDASPGQLPQWDYPRPGYACRVWHLTFESFFTRPIPPGQEALREEMRVLRDASRIPTRYRLEAGDLDAPQIQKILFEAARHLVRRETGLLDETCAWFRARGLAACETAR